MSAVYVGHLLPLITPSINIREFTQAKGRMRVLNVGNPLGQILTSLNTGEFTLEKSLTSVENVRNPFQLEEAYVIIRVFTPD